MRKLRFIAGITVLLAFLILILVRPPETLIWPGLAFLGLLKRGMAIIILCAFLCLFRIMRGPTHADRIAGMDMMGILIIGICALLSISTRRHWYMDIGIAWVLQSFITTLALAKFLEGKDFDD